MLLSIYWCHVHGTVPCLHTVEQQALLCWLMASPNKGLCRCYADVQILHVVEKNTSRDLLCGLQMAASAAVGLLFINFNLSSWHPWISSQNVLSPTLWWNNLRCFCDNLHRCFLLISHCARDTGSHTHKKKTVFGQRCCKNLCYVKMTGSFDRGGAGPLIHKQICAPVSDASLPCEGNLLT